MKTPILSALLLLAIAHSASAELVEFHVKPDGVAPFSSQDPNMRPDLDNPRKPIWARGGIEPEFWFSGGGTADKPFATLFQAQLAVRELLRKRVMNKQPAPTVKVIVHDGIYRLEDTLDFLPEDSGTPEDPVVYEAAPGAKPVFSGGVKITGWKRAETDIPGLPTAAKGNVWVAPAPEQGADTLDFRQLYVNGAKAIRARTPNEQGPDNAASYNRLQDWDSANRQVVVPASAVAPWRNLKRVEMALQQSWALSYLRFDTLHIRGDKAYITFQDPERTMVFARPYPWPRKDSPHHFVNALEFLDTPGEWYLDHKDGLVFYWPRAGEEMATAEAVAPKLESVLRLLGTLERPVHDLQFKGIAFAHTTWLRPSQKGHMAMQAGMFINRISYRIQGGIPEFPGLDNIGYVGRPPAGVYGAMCHHVSFEKCAFRNMASAGLDFHYGTHDDTVLRCTFTDIGGNGIQTGKFSDDGFAVVLPFNPKDPRELCLNDRFAHNTIRNCGTEDWGCCGIAAGFVTGIRIEHNDLSDLPYTGISVGWGWNALPNCMRDNKVLNNHIHGYMKRLGDGGGIYFLSNQSPSEIGGNWIHDICKSPVGDGGFMIYLDEGSSGVLVKDNLTQNANHARNRNGPGNRWENNLTTPPTDIRLVPGMKDNALKGGSSLDDAVQPFPSVFTVVAHVRLNKYPEGADARRWIVCRGGNERVAGNLSLFVDGRNLAAYLNTGGAFHTAAGGDHSLPLNQWTPVAASYDGDTLRVFCNGKEVAAKKIGKPFQPADAPLTLGARGDRFAVFDCGDMDEVRLFDRVLTPAEMRDLPVEGVVKHWPLDSVPAANSPADEMSRNAGPRPEREIPLDASDTPLPDCVNLDGKTAPPNPFNKDGLITRVEVPVLRIIRTAASKPKGTVLIFPSGAYHVLSATTDGSSKAQFWNDLGYDAAILEYTISEKSWNRDDATRNRALQDALAAVRLIRKQGKELGLHCGAFILMGGSAGGHLAARTVAALPEAERPDAMVLFYPAYLEEVQPGAQTAGMPLPAGKLPSLFVTIAANDAANWVAGARSYVEAWNKAPGAAGKATFHLFDDGGHGFNPGTRAAAQWPALLTTFEQHRP